MSLEYALRFNIFKKSNFRWIERARHVHACKLIMTELSNAKFGLKSQTSAVREATKMNSFNNISI